jgi:hypothetical protein
MNVTISLQTGPVIDQHLCSTKIINPRDKEATIAQHFLVVSGVSIYTLPVLTCIQKSVKVKNSYKIKMHVRISKS